MFNKSLTQHQEPDPHFTMNPEVLVPNGCLALLIQDGKPDRWFQPGPHSLSAAKGKVEVRLISSDILSEQDRDRIDWALAQAQALHLPYERSLLYVDGVQVAIVKPGNQVKNTLPGSLGSGLPVPRKEQSRSHSAASDGEDDLIQDFSFV